MSSCRRIGTGFPGPCHTAHRQAASHWWTVEQASCLGFEMCRERRGFIEMAVPPDHGCLQLYSTPSQPGSLPRTQHSFPAWQGDYSPGAPAIPAVSSAMGNVARKERLTHRCRRMCLRPHWGSHARRPALCVTAERQAARACAGE